MCRLILTVSGSLIKLRRAGKTRPPSYRYAMKVAKKIVSTFGKDSALQGWTKKRRCVRGSERNAFVWWYYSTKAVKSNPQKQPISLRHGHMSFIENHKRLFSPFCVSFVNFDKAFSTGKDVPCTLLQISYRLPFKALTIGLSWVRILKNKGACLSNPDSKATRKSFAVCSCKHSLSLLFFPKKRRLNYGY